MKQIRSLILLLLCLLTLAAIPAAAQEGPLGVPLSPEQAAGLPDALRNDPRASYGAIHITGFDRMGCSEFDPIANVTILVPPANEGITIHTKISRPGYVAMNLLESFQGKSGAYSWILAGFTSGGAVNENWPLTINTEYSLSVLLMNHKGEPLWYSEARFNCNGAPSFAATTSTPVRIVNVNPDFNKAGVTSAIAAKWTPAVKSKRTCTAVPGECAIKMTSKPGKTAQITQNKRFKPKPVAGEGSVFGLIVMYDTQTTGFVPGTLGYTMKLNGGASTDTRTIDSGGQTLISSIPLTVPQTQGGLFAGMTADYRLNAELTHLNINLTYDAQAKSKIFLRSAYFWIADLPHGFGLGELPQVDALE